jgi:hypothetical protein
MTKRLLTSTMTPADWAKVERLSREALMRDPLTVSAASSLGLRAQEQGDVTRARQIFRYANWLSRRDVQTQLWSIEDAVSRDDVQGALRHYDIAMRTSGNMQELLFPILGAAIADDAVRAELVKTMRRQPSWAPHFAMYAATLGSDPRAAARYLADLTSARMPPAWQAQSAMVTRLYEQVSPEAAWAHYAAAMPGADPTMSRDADFRADPATPSPFDWTPLNDDVIRASIQPGSNGGVFDFSVPSGVGGAVLQQVQMLPAGRYVLEGRSADINQSAKALPYWQLRCRSGEELGRIPVPASSTAGGAFRGVFVVPASCPVQVLALVTRPSDAVGGATGQILQARLVAAR